MKFMKILCHENLELYGINKNSINKVTCLNVHNLTWSPPMHLVFELGNFSSEDCLWHLRDPI